VSPPTFKLAGSTGATFKVVGSGSTAKTTATKYYNLTGFSLSMPTSWTKTSSGQSSFAATIRSKSGYVTRMGVSKVQGRGARSLTEWATALASSARAAGAVGTVAQRVVNLPGGNAVYLAFAAKDRQGRLVELVDYFFDAGSAAYGMGFVTLTSLVPTYQATFSKVAQSFRHK
jgi:hypothetical protein